jgi:hypothetical protein
MLTYKKLPAMIKYVMMETKWNKTWKEKEEETEQKHH